MKILPALSIAALMLAAASAASDAGEAKKNTAQTQTAAMNQQLSIKLLRLSIRAHQVNQ